MNIIKEKAEALIELMNGDKVAALEAIVRICVAYPENQLAEAVFGYLWLNT